MAEQASPRRARGDQGTVDEPVRVLVVDSDDTLAIAVRHGLGRTGSAEVTWVADPGAAVDFLRAPEHDVCFLAARLGSVDGLDVVQEAGIVALPTLLIADEVDDALDRQVFAAGLAGIASVPELMGPSVRRVVRQAKRWAAGPALGAGGILPASSVGLAGLQTLRAGIENSLRSLGRRHSALALALVHADEGAPPDALDALAVRLAGCCRPTELVVRLQAATFAVLAGSLDTSRGALRLVDRIRHAVSSGDVEATIGLAVTADTALSIDTVLDRAQEAAVRSGARIGGVEIIEDASCGGVVERQRLETNLAAAVDAGGIGVAYQPIVGLGTMSLVGFEALARWDHPSLGPVSPAWFIPAAEETGLIHRLGRQVVAQAIRQLGDWTARYPERDPLRVSVNLTQRQVHDLDLLSFFADLFDETGVDPATVSIEFTEAALVTDEARTIDALTKFRELGVRVAMDDFGAGTASLAHLQKLPVDILKIDRAMAEADELGHTPMVAAVGALGDVLGLELIAEGVEDGAHRRLLSAHGFGLGQGFLFSEAVDAAAAEDLIRRDLAARPGG